jgi:uncharacterized membrane protein YfcA
MKTAVGTSLVIIAVKSLIGFTGDIQAGLTVDWKFLLGFTALTIVGIFGGGYFSRMVDPCKLRRGFGWCVIAMAVVILIKELLM